MVKTAKNVDSTKAKLRLPLSVDSEKIPSKPFLKWVGGKTQIIGEIEKHLPVKFNRYFEPFLGGGAVFFRLIPKDKIAFLSDINSNLVGAYLDIRDRIYEVMHYLDRVSGNFVNIEDTNSREQYFYLVRQQYNSLVDSQENSSLKTALLIFLNKTCFNGVYRENSEGHFNVPFGKAKNSNSITRSNILIVSRDLQKKQILHMGFEEVLEKAEKDDFIYLDPPYAPIKKNSAFTKYHSSDFSEEDHRKLATTFDKLAKKGCFVMMSNSDVPLIKDLYKKYERYTVAIDANRNINCKGNLRKPVRELLIKNY
ncbi:Dam family site-specific DNA-(adenine-N6)-methyltransferase [Candidatus Parcubacteria bacterium]|nr:Dam family site-specific DNA-(adenine-N6)-methyltransferase [Candidatus Parcubacteria bacterium]